MVVRRVCPSHDHGHHGTYGDQTLMRRRNHSTKVSAWKVTIVVTMMLIGLFVSSTIIPVSAISCTNSSDCSNRGECLDGSGCLCDSGWFGAQCDLAWADSIDIYTAWRYTAYIYWLLPASFFLRTAYLCWAKRASGWSMNRIVDSQFATLFLSGVSQLCRAIWYLDFFQVEGYFTLRQAYWIGLVWMVAANAGLYIGLRIFISVQARLHPPTKRIMYAADSAVCLIQLSALFVFVPMPLARRWTLVSVLSGLFWLILGVGTTVYASRTLKHLLPAHRRRRLQQQQQQQAHVHPYHHDEPNDNDAIVNNGIGQHGGNGNGADMDQVKPQQVVQSPSPVGKGKENSNSSESIVWADAAETSSSTKAAQRLMRVIRLGQLFGSILLLQIVVRIIYDPQTSRSATYQVIFAWIDEIREVVTYILCYVGWGQVPRSVRLYLLSRHLYANPPAPLTPAPPPSLAHDMIAGGGMAAITAVATSPLDSAMVSPRLAHHGTKPSFAWYAQAHGGHGHGGGPISPPHHNHHRRAPTFNNIAAAIGGNGNIATGVYVDAIIEESGRDGPPPAVMTPVPPHHKKNPTPHSYYYHHSPQHLTATPPLPASALGTPSPPPMTLPPIMQPPFPSSLAAQIAQITHNNSPAIDLLATPHQLRYMDVTHDGISVLNMPHTAHPLHPTPQLSTRPTASSYNMDAIPAAPLAPAHRAAPTLTPAPSAPSAPSNYLV